MLRVVLALLVVALAVTGCGVGAQERFTPLVIVEPSRPNAPAPVEPGVLTVPVYYTQGAVLRPVTRTASEVTAQTALDLLVTGPSPREVASGLRTALSPRPLEAGPPEADSPRTVVVTASSDFASVSGGKQLLAVAQVVFTLTDLPGIEQVRFTVDGVPVEVPTDSGLTDRPVSRSHYQSVSPAQPAPSRSLPRTS